MKLSQRDHNRFCDQFKLLWNVCHATDDEGCLHSYYTVSTPCLQLVTSFLCYSMHCDSTMVQETCIWIFENLIWDALRVLPYRFVIDEKFRNLDTWSDLKFLLMGRWWFAADIYVVGWSMSQPDPTAHVLEPEVDVSDYVWRVWFCLFVDVKPASAMTSSEDFDGGTNSKFCDLIETGKY